MADNIKDNKSDKEEQPIIKLAQNIKDFIKKEQSTIIMVYIISLLIFLTNSPVRDFFHSPITADSKNDEEILKINKEIKDISARIEKLENNLSDQNHLITIFNSNHNSSANISREDFILLKNDVRILNKSINNIAFNPNLSYNDNFASMDSRLKVIEKAIVDNPERSLALFKLSNDMDNLRNGYTADLNELGKNIDRVYSFAQWFVYAIIFLAVGIMGILANSLRKKEA